MRFAIAALALTCAAAQTPVVFNDDGGWCWFEDERAVIQGRKLIIATVAAGTRDASRKGDVEVAVWDLDKQTATRATLHHGNAVDGRTRWLDDHNSPALLVRPDGRVLAMYAQHGVESKIYYRISAPNDPAAWGDEKIFEPSPKSRVTYSNLHWLAAEKRIYNFYRGFENSFKPSWMWSEDLGETWKAGRVFIDVPAKVRHRPYVKYASNGRDTVHFAYTDGHPRDFDNSIYHAYYRGGILYRSDGTPIRSLEEGLKEPGEGTRVFRGDPENVAWISDLHVDGDGRPWLVYSVQKDSAGMPDRQGGHDFRYRYARWDGKSWSDHEIAYGGSKLYPGEDDYTGNVCLDPQDPSTVFISSNADPVTNRRLPHWEIFRGVTKDGGSKWTWTPVTRDSAADNIRPIVPVWTRGHRALLWLRGKMRTYTDFDFSVVGIVE